MNNKIFNKLQLVKPVIEIENRVNLKPIVSVLLITYNHQEYITQSIESILNQKTNFDFEIIIGEDDSSDGTRKICLEYANKYPEKIRLLLHNKENKLFRNGHPTGSFNFLYSLNECRGRYVAVCDGDDYWHYNKKLQLQYDFLIRNTEYKTVLTDFTKLYVKTNTSFEAYNYYKKNERIDRDISNEKIFEKEIKITRTCTFFFDISIIQSFLQTGIDVPYDTLLILHALQEGKVRYLATDTSTYRIMVNSASKTNDFSKQQSFLAEYISIIEFSIPFFKLNKTENSYLNKQKRMYEIKEMADKKKIIKTLIIAIKAALSGHFSKNILKSIQHSFRKNK